jgi:hypothetical protein
MTAARSGVAEAADLPRDIAIVATVVHRLNTRPGDLNGITRVEKTLANAAMDLRVLRFASLSFTMDWAPWPFGGVAVFGGKTSALWEPDMHFRDLSSLKGSDAFWTVQSSGAGRGRLVVTSPMSKEKIDEFATQDGELKNSELAQLRAAVDVYSALDPYDHRLLATCRTADSTYGCVEYAFQYWRKIWNKIEQLASARSDQPVRSLLGSELKGELRELLEHLCEMPCQVTWKTRGHLQEMAGVGERVRALRLGEVPDAIAADVANSIDVPASSDEFELLMAPTGEVMYPVTRSFVNALGLTPDAVGRDTPLGRAIDKLSKDPWEGFRYDRTGAARFEERTRSRFSQAMTEGNPLGRDIAQLVPVAVQAATELWPTALAGFLAPADLTGPTDDRDDLYP